MPFDLDSESQYSRYDFVYMDKGDLSLETAKLVGGALVAGRHVAEILWMLESSRISKEVLQHSQIVYGLSMHENDEKLGKSIKKLLLRLLRINLGKQDALNQDITEIFRINDRKWLTDQEQDYFHSDRKEKHIQKRNFELMAMDEEKAQKKRKMADIHKRPVKYRKLESRKGASSSRTPVPTTTSPFFFPCDYVPIFYYELGKYEMTLVPKEIEFSSALKVALSLSLLPSEPSYDDVRPLTKHLTAEDLRVAEDIIGRQMNRVQVVWWSLLDRHFKRPTEKWADIREMYRSISESTRKQRKAEYRKQKNWTNFYEK